MGQRKNILITGASGFVGKKLVEKLLRDQQNIFLVSSQKDFKLQGVKIYYGDLSDQDFCHHILQRIDLVFYLAGYKKNVGYHVAKPFEFLAGNAAPLLSFLSATKGSQLKEIVYLSSVLVDGVSKADNTDGYILGKRINELVLNSFAAERTDIKIKIIRSAPIYGPGDHFEPKIANFIPALIGRVFKERDEVVAWGSGKRKMQFIYIDDLVDNIIATMSRQENFFIFGNQEKLSVKSIVSKIIKFLDKKNNFTVKFDLSKPDKPTKIFNFTNLINPAFNIDRGLKETIAFYKRNIQSE